MSWFCLGTLRLKGKLTPALLQTLIREIKGAATDDISPAGSRIWLVAGITDMRNGFNGRHQKFRTS
ncbi:protein of unknown function [Escherichia coli]|nr:protein of unknown function [Escherichia coli]